MGRSQKIIDTTRAEGTEHPKKPRPFFPGASYLLIRDLLPSDEAAVRVSRSSDSGEIRSWRTPGNDRGTPALAPSTLIFSPIFTSNDCIMMSDVEWRPSQFERFTLRLETTLLLNRHYHIYAACILKQFHRRVFFKRDFFPITIIFFTLSWIYSFADF